MKRNAKAWLIWIGVAALITMLARNPLYTLLILAVSLLMMAVFGRAEREGTIRLRRMAAFILLVSAIYNGLFVHTGETVLFAFPDWPLIGGPVTLEAVIEGLANGLVLLTLLTIFAALGAIVPMSELTRLIPGAFRDLGMVLLIAVNYVPETRRHLRRIREAQAIRGHEVHGLKDWRPLVVPLLVGGLERAMRLSETMVARGFGATVDESSHPAEQFLLIFGLLAAMVGWFIVVWSGGPGWLVMLGGVLAMLLVIVTRNRRTKRSNYRPLTWGVMDIAVTVMAIIALAIIVVPWPFVDRSSLIWTAYPRLMLPALDWLVILGLAGLAIPALLATVLEPVEPVGD